MERCPELGKTKARESFPSTSSAPAELGLHPAVPSWQVKVCPLLAVAGEKPWAVGRTMVAQGGISETI